MHNSRTKNTNYTFNEEVWVVSCLNTGSALGGHSVLLVEGLVRTAGSLYSQLFVGQYDIQAVVFQSGASSLSNVKGVISEIRAFEGADYTRDYASYAAASYQVSPELARQMIASIKEDQAKVAAFMAELRASMTEEAATALLQNEDAYLKYQAHGKHGLLTNSKNGDNCAGWCLEKMAIAGIGDGTGKPKPKMAAGCTLL